MEKSLFKILLLIIVCHVSALSASGQTFPSTAKIENADRFEYFITGLSTAADSTFIENTFSDRPGVTGIIVNLVRHKITVYASPGMPDADIREVIRFTGREVIR